MSGCRTDRTRHAVIPAAVRLSPTGQSTARSIVLFIQRIRALHPPADMGERGRRPASSFSPLIHCASCVLPRDGTSRPRWLTTFVRTEAIPFFSGTEATGERFARSAMTGRRGGRIRSRSIAIRISSLSLTINCNNAAYMIRLKCTLL